MEGNSMNAQPNLAPLLEGFFTQRLIAQRRASPHTIAAYRDTFRLLLSFVQKRSGRAPSKLTLADLNAPLIASFLDELESQRTNNPRSRNLRLSAIRSFFRYAALEAPEHSALIQRVLAIPRKRHTLPLLDFLMRDEIEALLSAPDRQTWIGQRDHAFLLVAVQTGLRLSELTGLRQQDVSLGTGAHVRCQGKGRKQRATPLTKPAVAVVTAWIKQQGQDNALFLFPSARGGRLSADAVQHLVARHVATAQKVCPSLSKKRITPHVLRHTAAMELLQAGVDRSLIAIWLGHESRESTEPYLHANLALKEEILAKTRPVQTPPGRYRPGDRLLNFLKGL
jgi:site-specific recombinase XerD